MNRKRTIPRRTTLLQRLAYILRPFVVYMIVKTAAMLTLELLAVNLARVFELTQRLQDCADTAAAVINAAASIVGVCFVLKDFLKEAFVSGEVDIDSGALGQLRDFMKGAFSNWKSIAVCAVWGAVSALVFNVIIGIAADFLAGLAQLQKLTGFEGYEAVKQIQYSVPLWLGLILYGIVSPFVEEAVFRGIVYSRIRRFYSVRAAVFFSAFLFGAFHGNLPQLVYGFLMGILLALCYERTKLFGAAVAFHAAANVAVFLASYL